MVETMNSNIADLEPIDMISAMSMLKTDVNAQMYLEMNLERTEVERLRSDCTEEVKFEKSSTTTRTNSSTCYQKSRHVRWKPGPN